MRAAASRAARDDPLACMGSHGTCKAGVAAAALFVQRKPRGSSDDATIRSVVRVRDLKLEMDSQFGEVRRKFAEIDQQFADLRRDLEQKIAEEGERTRRHFDIVAERISSDVAVLATNVVTLNQASADNRAEHITLLSALSDHELRLRVVELPRR